MSPAFVPTRLVPFYPKARPPARQSAPRRPRLAMLSNNCTRRQVLSTVGISIVSIMQMHDAAVADEEQTGEVFFKLPCNPEGCRPVEVRDYRIGSGPQPQRGSKVVLKWTGRLADRYGWPIQKEDAEEVTFVIGKDKLIEGFEEGLLGMREGGKRRMLIPSEKGYFDEKSQPLPARYGDRRRLFATVLNPRRFKKAGDLVIDVQVLRVRSP